METKKTIMDWLGGENAIDGSIRPFISQFKFLYYNISKMSATELKEARKLQTYIQLIRSIIQGDIDRIYSIITELEQANEMHYFETVILYVLHVTDSFSIDILHERLTVEGRKKLMTIAEKLRQEGIEKGRQEGRQEGEQGARLEIARKMLDLGKDEREIIEITGLTRKDLESLKN